MALNRICYTEFSEAIYCFELEAKTTSLFHISAADDDDIIIEAHSFAGGQAALIPYRARAGIEMRRSIREDRAIICMLAISSGLYAFMP